MHCNAPKYWIFSTKIFRTAVANEINLPPKKKEKKLPGIIHFSNVLSKCFNPGLNISFSPTGLR